MVGFSAGPVGPSDHGWCTPGREGARLDRAHSIDPPLLAVWDVYGMLILNHSYKTSPKNFADTNDWGLLYIYIYSHLDVWCSFYAWLHSCRSSSTRCPIQKKLPISMASPHIQFSGSWEVTLWCLTSSFCLFPTTQIHNQRPSQIWW